MAKETPIVCDVGSAVRLPPHPKPPLKLESVHILS